MNRDMAGPWALALGALALGVGAVAVELRRWGRDDDGEDTDGSARDERDECDRT